LPQEIDILIYDEKNDSFDWNFAYISNYDQS